jgi:16S rRNA processing protein RimM
VLAPKDELTPVAEHEVYLHDLLGLSVVRAGSLEAVGDVIDVYELPQGIMLDVRRPKGTVLVPFRPEVVTQVDLPGRRLIIDPPEGLIE